MLTYHGVETPPFIVEITKDCCKIIGFVVLSLYGLSRNGNGGEPGNQPTPPAPGK